MPYNFQFCAFMWDFCVCVCEYVHLCIYMCFSSFFFESFSSTCFVLLCLFFFFFSNLWIWVGREVGRIWEEFGEGKLEYIVVFLISFQLEEKKTSLVEIERNGSKKNFQDFFFVVINFSSEESLGLKAT